MNTISVHPKLVTLGIGLAITFVIGTVIAMLDHGQIANAFQQEQRNTCSGYATCSNSDT
jgi:hypothetical protein